ncbi:class I SAM-dependent methyltransferase [Actinokineospora auranticolor]|uniref:Methyltransferase family protein n=1 Tax=Actinokineospora auranticolor TaxID=155976 RepID=A0A2S6GBK3_9PSEU|nr:class I SAM-dependent methyltransferase [Actinokineospora auranticolor]PPK61221.1 methyltransferase family protein [Actinokineospora auranticolor]
MPDTDQGTTEFWEEFYGQRDQVWSGNPNRLLVREVEDEPAGRALDIGCAEGGDAVWLARRGWRVTAVDVSATALARAARHAAEAGVAEAIRFERHDLAESFPDGAYDLVSAQYFHSPVAHGTERADALRRAAELVAPGGVLLIVGHEGWPSWQEPHDFHLPTTAEVLESLALPDGWLVEVQETVESPAHGPDGEHGTRADNVLKLRRSAP